MIGYGDQTLFVEQRIIGEHTVHGAAERAGQNILFDRTADPALKERPGDTVSRHEAADAGAGADNFTGAVGIGHPGIGYSTRRRIDHGHQIPVVDAVGVNTDQDLTGTRFGRIHFGQVQRVDAVRRYDFVAFHDVQLSCLWSFAQGSDAAACHPTTHPQPCNRLLFVPLCLFTEQPGKSVTSFHF